MYVHTLAFFFVVVLVVQKVVLVVNKKTFPRNVWGDKIFCSGCCSDYKFSHYSFPNVKIVKIVKNIFSSETIVNTAFL
jgi:hypothetical protein